MIKEKGQRKKGQAALEFLMTYGWAILVVLVSIGALAYFGVLSPDRFLPAKCTLQTGVTCLDHKATATGATPGVDLYLQNNIGFDIDTIVVSVGGCGTDNSPASLANGGTGTYNVPCTFTPSQAKLSAQLNFSYRVIETGISHNNVGSLVTRIE